MPIGLYTVEVSGNDEFQSSKREINIVNDEDRDELLIYVAMKPRAESSIEFHLMSTGANGVQHKMKSEGVNVKAILLPTMPLDQDNQAELDEYEFDVLFDTEKGAWTADLFNGNYLINVKAPGYAESNQHCEVRHGKRSFKVNCAPKA